MKSSVLVVCSLAAGLSLAGCKNDAQTGTLIGAGVGALAGQAIGGNTAGTLIGAGIGAGAGYAIGNEQDKAKAQERERARGAQDERLRAENARLQRQLELERENARLRRELQQSQEDG